MMVTIAQGKLTRHGVMHLAVQTLLLPSLPLCCLLVG
jgi:hypothetical protein